MPALNQYVALLRGINVSGKNKVPMKELKPLCETLGWENIRTHLQTGNVIFSTSNPGASLEVDLEQAVEAHFGFSIPVIVREAKTFEGYLMNAPFPEQRSTEPSWVLLYTTKLPISPEALQMLESRASLGEEIVVAHDSLWIYFPEGVGESKLSPSVIDRAVGSMATGRNWNTVVKIQEVIASHD